METCYEAPTSRVGELRERLEILGESVGSEWIAFGQALSARGPTPVRKWLGWALYRVAARVNPEIEDR